MRKTRSFLLVVASLVALLAVPARSMAAGDGTLLGFTDDLVRVARAAPAVQGTSQVARITIFWRGVAAGVHGVNWLEVDRAVDAAGASGQRVLFTVYGVQAPDLGEWAAFLRAMHERYPDMWAVQAWNEPNLANIGGNISVEEAAAIVMTAREALPGVPLIGPSISPTVDGAAAYQHALYGLLPDDIGVAVNLYTYRDNNTIPDVVDDFRTAKADGGDAPVYVTEIGFHGSYFTDQAGDSARAFGALRREGAKAVIFYRLLSNPAQTANWEVTGHFNVLNDDLSPTPILTALRGAVADTTPPAVQFRRASVNKKKRKATIDFSADDLGLDAASFTCQLDKQEPAPCTPPVTFKRLKYGKHKLVVTAVDAGGNEATFVKKFKIKRP